MVELTRSEDRIVKRYFSLLGNVNRAKSQEGIDRAIDTVSKFAGKHARTIQKGFRSLRTMHEQTVKRVRAQQLKRLQG